MILLLNNFPCIVEPFPLQLKVHLHSIVKKCHFLNSFFAIEGTIINYYKMPH